MLMIGNWVAFGVLDEEARNSPVSLYAGSDDFTFVLSASLGKLEIPPNLDYAQNKYRRWGEVSAYRYLLFALRELRPFKEIRCWVLDIYALSYSYCIIALTDGISLLRATIRLLRRKTRCDWKLFSLRPFFVSRLSSGFFSVYDFVKWYEYLANAGNMR